MYTIELTAIRALALSLVLLIAACSATSVQRSGEGAMVGAAAGAVGSMFSAAIFGGDIGDAALRGAAWGAGAGAVTGAIQGSAEDERRRQQEAAEREARQASELQRLKAEIGDDAFAGLEALTVGKHEVAMAYARTATRSSNRDHELAGHWLELLTWFDEGNESEVNRHLPHLGEMDPSVTSTAEARQMLVELADGLAEIRQDFGVKI